MTINYLETLPIISVFQNQVQWINPAALSLMVSNPSKRPDRILMYNFAKTMLLLIDWSIQQSVDRITDTLVGRDLWWSLIQPLSKAGHKRWDQHSLCVTCSGKPPRVEFTPHLQLQVPKLPIWALSCSWAPPVLPFISAPCSTLYHWQEFVSIAYGFSFSSFSFWILHPWRYLKVEQAALKVTLFQTRVGIGVSRGALHPKLFHDFAIRLNSNRFLHKRHQSKVTYQEVSSTKEQFWHPRCCWKSSRHVDLRILGMVEQCEQAVRPCVLFLFLGRACLEQEAVNWYFATLLSWIVSPFLDLVLFIITWCLEDKAHVSPYQQGILLKIKSWKAECRSTESYQSQQQNT